MDKAQLGVNPSFGVFANGIKESKGTSTLFDVLLAMTHHSHHHPIHNTYCS